MIIYPRHKLDIGLLDLAAGIFSYLIPLRKSKLEEEIVSFWNKKYVRVSFTVRTALDSMLTSLKLPSGSEVLMSAINIKDIVDIVESHGLNVVAIEFQYKDLTISGESVEKYITSNTKVLIFAQLFGAIVDLEPLYKVCKKHSILLIEDCAQAFCGTEYHGSDFADISLFSFGPIKSSTALGGAIVIARSEKHIIDSEAEERKYPAKTEIWYLKRVLKYSFLRGIQNIYIYSLLLFALKVLNLDLEKTINGLARGFPKGGIVKQIQFQPPLHMLFLLRRRLKNNCKENFRLRRDSSNEFVKKLGPSFIIPGKEAEYNSFWVLPVLSNNPKALQIKMMKNGFDSTRGSHAQIAICNEPNAECFLDRVLYLPSVTHLKRKDVARLVLLLKADKEEIT